MAVLPFEALVVSGTPQWTGAGANAYPEGLTYLGDVYPISYYESITALTLERRMRKPQAKAQRVLVLADPVFSVNDER